MPEQLTRDRILDALREMPPDATIDDAIERLVFLAKIEAGVNELDAGLQPDNDLLVRVRTKGLA